MASIVTVKINYNTSTFTMSSNALTVKASTASGNTLSITSSGLYAVAKKGTSGSGGTGYSGKHAGANRVDTGYRWPGQTKSSSATALEGRVYCELNVHRVFKCDKITDGVPHFTNFRSNLDYVMPGDLFIYNSKYYVITDVTIKTNGDVYLPGNAVSNYVAM